MKRSLIIIFILLLLTIAYFITSGNGISYETEPNGNLISPFSKDFSLPSKLYFIHVENLVSEVRTVKVEMLETELAVLKALQKGSKIETYSSPIPDDVRFISVDTTDRTCFVNLSSDFLTDDYDLMELRVLAIVNSITEFESIDFVQVLVEGKKIQIGNDRLGNPLTKNTSKVQDDELEHKDIMRKFLEYITLSRYDLAFDLIDNESKQKATFREFKETATVIKNDLKGYTLSYVFAKREQGRFIMQVKYILRDSPSSNDLLLDVNIRESIPFSWPMIQEDGVWKVKFVDF